MSKSDVERQKFGPYIRCIADMIGLRDWSITLSDDPPENSCTAAEIWCAYGRRHATLFLSKHFLGATAEEQRHVICHELIHAHFGADDNFLIEALNERDYAEHVTHTEYGVDGLATVIAEGLPLPSQVKVSRSRKKS